MAYFIWLLRIIHIVGGVFWVGAALTMTLYIVPTIRATGEAGQKFMGQFMGKTNFTAVITTASILNILAGFILYGITSNWFTSAWSRTGPGMGFGIGAGFALIGWVFGILIGRGNGQMAKLGAQIQGKPTAEQLASIQTLQKNLGLYSKINGTALIIAVIFMSIARYL
ncbi:MAG: hypothetical protein U0Z26_08345 [Anaerolineales bacterium]